ncbi:MAG: hypothetical protein EXR59_00020 [Dehalococcoidia bacterium]|nr:hypothetical protein [Dehalococcoidia bacterium]
MTTGQAAQLLVAEVTYRKDYTEDIFVLRLKTNHPYAFKAGQYCTLGIGEVERAYSIVSAPDEKEIELIIELVHNGEMTPLMHKLKVGDKMSCRPRAKGIFTLDEKLKNHVMLATVTGVAPYISILRYYNTHPKEGHNFYVFYGGSYADELVYHKEFSDMAMKMPNLKYFATISRPTEERNKGWNGYKGRVNVLADLTVPSWQLDAKTTMFYACGHPGMIENVKEKFKARGYQVKEERFWKE